MSYSLSFELAGLPPSANGSHGDWRSAWKEQQRWKEAARLRCFLQRPTTPLEKAKVTCTRFSTRKPDRDNLAFSFKRILDGVVAAGVLKDDSDDVIVECSYHWSKVGPRMGKIRVVIEEVAA